MQFRIHLIYIIHVYSMTGKTWRDGSCLKYNLCTHFQHFLFARFPNFSSSFYLLDVFSAFISLSGRISEPLSLWQVTKMTQLLLKAQPLRALHACQHLYHNPWKKFGNYDMSSCSFLLDLDKIEHSAAVFCAQRPRWW